MIVFAAVVRDGTFTAAAKSLGITKQSISHRIARLESRIGVELLYRSTRLLRLTEAGARYHDACTSILAQVEAIEREVRRSQQGATGTVRVTAPVGLRAPLVIPAAKVFQRAHPAVHLDLIFEERRVDLVREGIDLALRAGSVASTPSFIARLLFKTAYVIVASPEYIGIYGKPKDPGAMAQLPCVATQRSESWVLDGQTIVVSSAVVVNSHEAARDAAAAGIGMARIPLPTALDDVHAGRLEIVFGNAGQIPVTALWPAKRLPVRVRLFLEFLAHRAREFSDEQLQSRLSTVD
jgi:DNA-binding transcriptional LysR family regulator